MAGRQPPTSCQPPCQHVGLAENLAWRRRCILFQRVSSFTSPPFFSSCHGSFCSIPSLLCAPSLRRVLSIECAVAGKPPPPPSTTDRALEYRVSSGLPRPIALLPARRSAGPRAAQKANPYIPDRPCPFLCEREPSPPGHGPRCTCRRAWTRRRYEPQPARPADPPGLSCDQNLLERPPQLAAPPPPERSLHRRGQRGRFRRHRPIRLHPTATFRTHVDSCHCLQPARRGALPPRELLLFTPYSTPEIPHRHLLRQLPATYQSRRIYTPTAYFAHIFPFAYQVAGELHPFPERNRIHGQPTKDPSRSKGAAELVQRCDHRRERTGSIWCGDTSGRLGFRRVRF